MTFSEKTEAEVSYVEAPDIPEGVTIRDYSRAVAEKKALESGIWSRFTIVKKLRV